MHPLNLQSVDTVPAFFAAENEVVLFHFTCSCKLNYTYVFTTDLYLPNTKLTSEQFELLFRA